MKFRTGASIITNKFMYDADKIEIVETLLGRIRKIKNKDEYIAGDIAKAVGLAETKNLVNRISDNNKKILSFEESKYLGLRGISTGYTVVSYEGVKEYSRRSILNVDWNEFLSELNSDDTVVQQKFTEVKKNEKPLKMISKMFEETPVKMILDKNGDILFELYSTGMALGQVVKNSKGTIYPNKERIDKNVVNAGIEPCLRNANKYITESMLYDLMLEAKTEKCKFFRKWITNEVLPTIRKTGGYVNDTDKFVDNYLSNLPDETKEIIKSGLENKNRDLLLEKRKIEQELESNFKVIELINEVG